MNLYNIGIEGQKVPKVNFGAFTGQGAVPAFDEQANMPREYTPSVLPHQADNTTFMDLGIHTETEPLPIPNKDQSEPISGEHRFEGLGSDYDTISEQLGRSLEEEISSKSEAEQAFIRDIDLDSMDSYSGSIHDLIKSVIRDQQDYFNQKRLRGILKTNARVSYMSDDQLRAHGEAYMNHLDKLYKLSQAFAWSPQFGKDFFKTAGTYIAIEREWESRLKKIRADALRRLNY